MNKTGKAELITIVTPVYNGEAFLAEFINSVLTNTYENWELLLVDDGSTDRSAEIIKEFAEKEPRIKYIESKHHNAGYSRNLGMEHAGGEYICFLDCDDIVDKAYLEEMHKALVDNDANLAFCKSNAYLQDTGEYKNLDWSFRKRFFPEQIPFSRKQCPDNLFQTNLIAAWNKMARISLLRDNHIQAQSIASANDVVLTCLMMACAKKIVPVDKVLYTQRRNNRKSITANLGNTTYRCGYMASERLHAELKNRNLLEEVRVSYQKLAAHNCIWYLEKVENNCELFREQYVFLRNEGFRNLDIDELDEKSEKGFLDKKELQKYHDVKNLTIEEFSEKYEIIMPVKKSLKKQEGFWQKIFSLVGRK